MLEVWKLFHAFHFSDFLRLVNPQVEQLPLAYPKAEQGSFWIALISYNILATLKSALASVQGIESVERVSDFYVVDEIQGTYRGMMMAIAPEHWHFFGDLSLSNLAERLKQ